MFGEVLSLVEGNLVTVERITYVSSLFCKTFRVLTRLSRKVPEGKRPLGRLRRRWEDNIKMDLQEVVCGGMD